MYGGREKRSRHQVSRTFYRFMCSKAIASVSWNLFMVFFMWKVVSDYHSIFLAGAIASIYLVVEMSSSIPIGHLIDKVNNTRLNMISSILMGLGFSVFLLGSSLDYVYIATAITSFGFTLKMDSFAAIIKKHVPDGSITRATSYNQASSGLSSLIGYALGGVSLLFLSESAPLILLTLTLVSLVLSYPVSEARVEEVASGGRQEATYSGIFSFFRKITGFVILALIINGFFVSLDVYGSGIFKIYLGSTPLFYTMFVCALPLGMIGGSFMANRFSDFFNNPAIISATLIMYAPILVIIGISRSPTMDVAMAGILGFVNPLVNVPLVSRLTKFTPREIFGKVFAFLKIFLGSSTPVMATVFSFLSLFASVPDILLAVGLLMIPISLLGLGVIRGFYHNTEVVPAAV